MLRERAIHVDVLIAGHGMRSDHRMHPGTVTVNTVVHRLNVGFFTQVIISETTDVVHCLQGFEHIAHVGR